MDICDGDTVAFTGKRQEGNCLGTLIAENLESHVVFEENKNFSFIGETAGNLGIGAGKDVGEGMVEPSPEDARDEGKGGGGKFLQCKLGISKIFLRGISVCRDAEGGSPSPSGLGCAVLVAQEVPGRESGRLAGIGSMVDCPENAAFCGFFQPIGSRGTADADKKILHFRQLLWIYDRGLGKFQHAFIHNVSSIRKIWGEYDIIQYVEDTMER